jgi:hypothetical protein
VIEGQNGYGADSGQETVNCTGIHPTVLITNIDTVTLHRIDI